MYFMVRNFDQSGYYETRVILALAMFAIALWRMRRGDHRFLVMFVSGVLFQGLLEWLIASGSARGANYVLGLFGLRTAGLPAFLLQGFLEGGPASMLGYWFVDLLTAPAKRQNAMAYLGALAGVVALALLTGYLAAGAAITSVRPMFQFGPVILAFPVVALALAALRGVNGVKLVLLYFVGVAIYFLANFEPMQLFMIRYIGVGSQAAPTPAPLWDQIWVMPASIIFETALGKLHYLALPLVLGLLDPPRRAKV